MSRDLDPEQLADLRVRAESERDRTRSREAVGFGDTTIVERWPCRRCTIAMVDVNAATVTALEVSNAQLLRRGERAIPKSHVVFCSTCEPIARLERAEREAVQRAEIRALERELFSLVDNDLREASIATRLRELGHANVPALLRQAATRRAEKAREKNTNGTRRNSL